MKRRKIRQKFDGTEVGKVEEVRKYFVNLKFEIKVFSCITSKLDFKNMSCAIFLLHMKKINSVWYIMAFHRLFLFIACVSLLYIFFFFS